MAATPPRLKKGESDTARKTTTSTEVKSRWNAKTYKRYGISLRKDEDNNLIEFIETEKRASGKDTTAFFRDILLEAKKNRG